MEIYQLKTFLAVAEEQHLTRAAERLHHSQPSVSAQIKALEEELGLVLFRRTPKGMLLSRAGEALKAQAQAILLAVCAFEHQAAELKGGIAGEIRLGINIDPQYLKIDDLLLRMRRESPSVGLHFLQKHSLEALQQIRRGELDGAFVFTSPKDGEFESRRLSTFGVVIAGPPGWDRRLRGAGLEDLAGLPWVWADRRCPFFEITRRLFEPFGRMPEKSVTADFDATLGKLVASGAGLGLMLEPEAVEAARRNEVAILFERVAELDLAVIYLKKRASDPLLAAVVERISRVWAEVQEKGGEKSQSMSM